jgi:alcohol dehydrogenase class IV
MLKETVMFSPFCPVDIRILDRVHGLEAIKSLLEGTDGLCVLAGETMAARLDLNNFIQDLMSLHGGVWLTNIPANPSVFDVAGALKALAGQKVNTILTIGGGSAMDLGKSIAALHGHFDKDQLTEENILKAISEKAYIRPCSIPSLLAVPTTAGTGSEVTHWATVWNPSQNQKLSVDWNALFPKAAVIIPEFTISMGPELTLSTGLDALSHAMEAFWARSRTPLSQALAFRAIEKIHRFLPEAVKPEKSSSLALRQEMCLGALLAGHAFSITRTTACHAISYPLTMMFGLPHGFAAAMTLGSVMKRNEAAVKEIQSIRAMFIPEGGFDHWIHSLADPVRPLRLSSFGIGQEVLPAIIDLSFTAGRMDNNPIEFSRQDVLEILKECL